MGLFLLCALACAAGRLWAGWVSVGDGIEYQAFTAAGPNNLFVSRMARANANAFIDTSIAHDMMQGSVEIVRNQAARQDDAITWWGGSWGARGKAVVAINGGFYDTSTYVISGGQIQSGWYAHWFADSFSGFAWKMNRTPFIGQCVIHQAAKVYVRFMGNNATEVIDGINRAPGSSDLVIFTPQYNNQTPAGTRTEVLVEMSKPNLTTSGTSYSSGVIRSVVQNTGSTWIPFDHVVLSAAGSEGTTLKANATPGTEVRIFQELVEKNEPDVQGLNACASTTGQDWANTFSTINGNFRFLENSVVRVPDAVTHPGYLGYVNLNPRTAICYSPVYVFFVICDGRSAQSVGMSCETLGNWAKSVLGATDGVNLDGGGSSTMVVNGSVMNVPSDGSERAVCNGVLMLNLQPKVSSTTFSVGQTVTTSGSASLRLGPGVNYGLYATINGGTTGTIQSHGLNGVFAKGYYWWKCSFPAGVGWIAESLLSVPSTAPSILQQPSNQAVSEGGAATFSVVASGTSPLSYQWQKSAARLTDGGHYSGCTTPSLVVSGADANDVAGYRCVVTNNYGSVTSTVATLTLGGSCNSPALINGNFELAANALGISSNWLGYQRAPYPATTYTIQTASPPTGGLTQYQQIQTSPGTGGAGVRQDVTGCTIGATYRVTGWMRGNSGSFSTCRVKVSPTASADWATAIDLNPPQTMTGSAWTSFGGTVVATSTNMTLWLDGQTLTGATANKAACFDVVEVACVAPAAPLQFQSASIVSPTQVRLVVSGPPGVNVTIRRSTDSLGWQVVTNLANTSGTVQFIDTATSSATARFYRATLP